VNNTVRKTVDGWDNNPQIAQMTQMSGERGDERTYDVIGARCQKDPDC
jgi:hypothetical protein